MLSAFALHEFCGIMDYLMDDAKLLLRLRKNRIYASASPFRLSWQAIGDKDVLYAAFCQVGAERSVKACAFVFANPHAKDALRPFMSMPSTE